MRISVIHATRRPDDALAMRQLWLLQAVNPAEIEWIFGIDEDDADSLTHPDLLNHPRSVSLAGGGCVRAYNDAAKLATGDVFLCASDDMHPIPNWDRIIVERLSISLSASGEEGQGEVALPPLVLCVGDGFRPDRLMTLQIFTRAWYDRFGFVFPPQFKSMGGDLWLTERAFRDGCAVVATDLEFEHKHPYYKKAEMDAVYVAENSHERMEEGRKLCDALLEKLPISLCIIVGNEALHLERCLESAKGAFDELCLARAIGTAEPDSTIQVAQEWCIRNRIPFYWAEYHNKLAFPHVDNFAAARNLSFGLATSYWRLWLDADDVLDEVNCQRIREAAKTARFDAHAFRYVMPTGGEYFRERLIAQGKGRWKSAVHETCVIDGAVCQVPQIEIRHGPLLDKSKISAERNLRIMETMTDRTGRDWFYFHEELYRLERHAEASNAAIKALACDLDIVERYEIYLNMMDLDKANSDEWGFKAVNLDPQRREALALLVQNAMHRGEVHRAAALFRMMDALKLPAIKPWTHRHIWHGWARNFLEVEIYRMDGQAEKANELRAKYMQDPTYAAAMPEYERKAAA